MRRLRNLVLSAAENIGLPLGTYLLLDLVAGWTAVWALVGAAATSVVVITVRYVRTRRIDTLGALVLFRFALDIALAVSTGDARLLLAKDFAITGAIGLAAGATMFLRRPFIARIRRDLEPDPAAFELLLDNDTAYRNVHRTLTATWAATLTAKAILGIIAAYTLPVTTTVVGTNIITPTLLIGLIVWTEYRARRARPAAAPDDDPRVLDDHRS